jgi:hypothetical protein
MPKTMREQLEESFEQAEEEETGGSFEDTEESVGDPETETYEDTEIDDDAGEPEELDEDSGDESVSAEEDEPGDEEAPQDEEIGKEYAKPPVSWKPAIREHWKSLPKDVKAEVMRREGEIQKGLQQASGYRKVAEEYLSTVKPFQPLMQSMGASPSQAIQTVMGTVAQLSQGTTTQKAEVIAQIIKDYAVDIEALDSVLSGEELPENIDDPLLGRLEEKLQPIYGFMDQMQGYQQSENQSIVTKAAEDIQSFSTNEKNEFFEDVRTVMADYLEVAANNKRVMSLQEAYDRACQDDPEIRKVLAQREAARKAQPTGDELMAKRRAASSVSGSPNAGGKLSEDASLHDVIAAQFDEAENLR